MTVVLFGLGYEKRREGVDGRSNRPVKARLYNRMLSTELGPPDGPAYLNRAVHVPSPLFILFRVWTTAVFPLPVVCQKGIKVLVGISGPLLVAFVRVVGFSFKRRDVHIACLYGPPSSLLCILTLPSLDRFLLLTLFHLEPTFVNSVIPTTTNNYHQHAFLRPRRRRLCRSRQRPDCHSCCVCHPDLSFGSRPVLRPRLSRKV